MDRTKVDWHSRDEPTNDAEDNEEDDEVLEARGIALDVPRAYFDTKVCPRRSMLDPIYFSEHRQTNQRKSLPCDKHRFAQIAADADEGLHISDLLP